MIDSFRLVVAMDKEELVKLEEEASSLKTGAVRRGGRKAFEKPWKEPETYKSKRLTQTWREPQRDLRRPWKVLKRTGFLRRQEDHLNFIQVNCWNRSILRTAVSQEDERGDQKIEKRQLQRWLPLPMRNWSLKGFLEVGRSWKNGIRSILNMSWIQEAEMPEALEGA